VTWRTDQASDSLVSYGTGTTLDREAYSGEAVVRHEVVIRDLDPTTAYSLQVVSRDSAGNVSAPSAIVRATTPRSGVADQTAAAFAAGDTTGDMRADELGRGALTLEPRDDAEGTFRSRVLDARVVADWNRPMWDATVPTGATLEVSVRTGDTRDPDETWSSWTRLSGSSDAVGETAQYLQYEIRMTAVDANRRPSLNAIGFTHLSTPPIAIGEVPR
jgi:chitodextrinase